MRGVGIAVAVLSGVISVAWYMESVICGRCFISTYLAPLAIVGTCVAVVLLTPSRRHHDSS